MTQPRDHKDCKYFGLKKCPYSNDDIMKRATQDLPSLTGAGNYPTLDFPVDEEINEICKDCASFTLK
jgi:hypothetical protein